MEPIEAEVYNYPIKKQNSKTQFTTFTEQHKFKKNKDFYKAICFSKKKCCEQDSNINPSSFNI